MPLLVLALALAAVEPEPAPDSAQQIQAEANEASRFSRKEAESWHLEIADAERTKLDLRSEPVLRWSNPAAGRVYGSVFVWTHEGRPLAAGSIYRWYAPYVQRTVELVSLSPRGLTAVRQGKTLWTPAAGQVEFHRLEEAPTPAASGRERLAQMRRLARDFVPELTDRRVVAEGSRQQLRLMDQPVYQYAAGAGGLLDGALFAFVVGTDPELLLLLEAREIDGGRHWEYALARMNRDALRVRYHEHEVWSVPYLEQPWADPKKDYSTIEIGNLPNQVVPEK